ncbi:hypothetical protein A4A49_65536, partial [Nicotiana attenuata]
FCDYCKRSGHTKDKCFKLHGYPQDFNHNPKYQKVKTTAANVHGTPIDNFPVNGEEMQPQSNNSNVSLTKEQYGQLVTLLQHFQTSSVGDNPDNSANGGNANFVGIFACSVSVLSIDFGLLSCKCFKSRADIWILDSGASNHMTFNKSLLTHIKTSVYPMLITLPNGYRVKVTEIGTVTLAPNIILHKVLYVPSFKYNLISIHSL